MGQAEDSILTELKQAKECERYPNRFRRLHETLLPKKLGKHCQNGEQVKTEPETKLLILKENSKPQDLVVYTDGSATKDQLGRSQARCDHHP